jgi:hypothetical protein
MIIVKLWGGIGNLLFQYVFGQYLQYRYHHTVTYDINSYIKVDKLRRSVINAIRVNEKIVFNNYFFSKYRGVKNRILRYAF